MTVIVSGGGNQPPVVNAGADQTIRQSDFVTLLGSAIDDGLPPGSTLAYTWGPVSAPPGAVLTEDFNSPTLVAMFTEPGTYELALLVSDTELTGYDVVTVTVLLPPCACRPLPTS